MENPDFQAAIRRNLQKRGWGAYLKLVVRVLELDGASLQLLEASESLRFERELFAKTRKGLADGSIHRITEVSEEELDSTITSVFSDMAFGPVIIAPANSMQFAFAVPYSPLPKQLHDLVLLDGVSVFVVAPYLDCGLG